MLITGNTIKKYRKQAKRMGLWDENYSTIKRDLIHVINDIRSRDFALDILGASFQQIAIIVRLTVYGDYEVGISEQDVKALYAPLECLESLDFAPSLLHAGAEKMVKDLLPTVFDAMADSKSLEDFEHTMRGLISVPADIATVSLSYGIALGTSMRKFRGMEVFFEPLIDKLDVMLKNSEKYKELNIALKKRAKKQNFPDGNTADNFAAMFAAASVECNMKKTVSFDQMYDLMSDIHKYGRVNSRFDKFLDSEEFRFLMKAIEGYYEIKD